ncbi:pumilio homolog 3 [Linepithema humile]|uniref:pumilio homolog 3 n=1 Tax=Linepithema humile TaxID=83485 RepID=UPI0006233169|nr:PREDICTED: protein penguin [Linepithema humile]
MKRKAENLDADNIKTNNDVETDNKKKKKVRFEKSLDKPTSKNIKTPIAKKNSQGNNVKLAKNNATIEKINQLKLKKKKELGQKSEATKKKNSKDNNVELVKNNVTTEKTDWLKLKKERKELREKRRAKKVNNDTVYDKIIQAKKISEKLRRSDCTLQERVKLARTLHEMLKTHYNKVIFTHDMSRVVQCIIKYCEADVRQTIVREIKPFITQMLESKYAKNCIRTILKHGSREIKNDVISAFYGNIVRLMSHAVSAPLIELTYSTWCTDLDKIYFKQEFFGDLYKLMKDKTVISLSDVFETAMDMKTATLSAVKTNLVRILNKSLINSTLLHTVIWEFFCVCSVEDRNELIVMLRDFIITLSQTKMGAKVAAQCIWHGNNKDRKVIMKAFKENVKTVCTSEYGYMTLLALLDSVDDTVIMKKIILSELQQDLIDIALNEYGRRVILYLVARRDSHYFPPSIVEYLQKGDNNSISKKPADIREKELLETIRDPLLDAVIADAATWLSNGAIAMVTLAILKVGSGQKLHSAFESIAKFISNVDAKIKENDAECNLVEHPGLHMMLKKLIQNDQELLKKDECTFGEILISRLTAEVLQKWIEFNRACFLLIFLIENESESNTRILSSKLKPLTKNLVSKKNSGASILLKKLKKYE